MFQKYILYSLLLIFVACSNKKNITNKKDYESFMNNKFHKSQIFNNESEIDFWNKKLLSDTGSFVNMMQIGLNKLAHFKLTGNIDDVLIADSLFFASEKKLNNKDANIYFSLSQNAITQHQFKNALKYIYQAEKIGADAYTLLSLKFDVFMELGYYNDALDCLNRLKLNTNNFDYLIRRSKYEDYLGNAENSLSYMEQALVFAKKINRKSTISWVTTNLADMYGHNGKINEAYQLYLQSLQIDSANLYALKGIANICFAKDNNSVEAKRIANFIQSQTQNPDALLTLSEIERWEGNVTKADEILNRFLKSITNPKYGNMYNKYLIEIYNDQINEQQKALEIARNEIENRATPETYSWLAYSLFKNNQLKKANDIVQNNVIDKTKEPHALFLSAQILKKSNSKLSKKLAISCLESEFELGPDNTKKIRNQILN